MCVSGFVTGRMASGLGIWGWRFMFRVLMFGIKFRVGL